MHTEQAGRFMEDEDARFEDIRALSDEADAMGLADVAIVLEFALDVFLKETGAEAPPSPAGSMEALTRSAHALQIRKETAPQAMPRIGWTMSSFPLANMSRKAS